MRIYYEGIESATLSYDGTANSGYPETNLQDRNKNTLFQDTVLAAGNSLTIDLGSARACNYVTLINYSNQSDTVLKLEYSADNVSYFTAFFNFDVSGAGNQIINTFSSKTKRYWKLTFSDVAIATSKTISMGAILLGTIFETSTNPDINEQYSLYFSTKSAESIGGNRFSSTNFADFREKISLNWQYINETEREKWRNLFETVKISDPFSVWPFLIYDSAKTDYYYCRIMQVPDIQQVAYQAYQMSLEIQTEI